MSDEDAKPGLARGANIPLSISTVARDNLAKMMALNMAPGDAPQTVAEWDARTQAANQMLLAMIQKPAAGTSVEPVLLGETPAFEVIPPERVSSKICLYLHGGAMTMGGGEVCGAMTASFAEGAHIRTIGVDYRMPPHHPYPVPLDDALAAYRALLEQHAPDDIVVAGMSAGGNLASALILRGRDEGVPPPSGLILLSPQVDLTESGDSFETMLGIDPVLTSRLTGASLLYADGHDLRDPYLSPLFGDFSPGFPRTFLQCGTRDLLLSNTVRFHRALRQHAIASELHVFEAMPHGGFGSILEGGLGKAPEDQDVYLEIQRFVTSLD